MSTLVPEQKIVTITTKRQFTIPQKFFTELGFEREAVCTMGNGMLIIEPSRRTNDAAFSEQILEELIAEGYKGQDLLLEFKRRQAKVRPAVEEMLKAAEDAVNGAADFATYKEIFNK